MSQTDATTEKSRPMTAPLEGIPLPDVGAV